MRDIPKSKIKALMFSSERKSARGKLENGGKDNRKQATIGVATTKMQKLRRKNTKSGKD